MPRRVVRKERGVFEKATVPTSDGFHFEADGVEHREKVGRRGGAIKLYGIRSSRWVPDPFQLVRLISIPTGPLM